ncbi:hypothetical protein [Leptolyngbya ohadii]|uniref:hypothetical protein n=1 Tax=Leptolyngbya ohadii TaxID=1962290 RepID=UPI00117A26ED|nr:hypothetical protein [Leptolyngbya ohadii]
MVRSHHSKSVESIQSMTATAMSGNKEDCMMFHPSAWAGFNLFNACLKKIACTLIQVQDFP